MRTCASCGTPTPALAAECPSCHRSVPMEPWEYPSEPPLRDPEPASAASSPPGDWTPPEWTTPDWQAPEWTEPTGPAPVPPGPTSWVPPTGSPAPGFAPPGSAPHDRPASPSPTTPPPGYTGGAPAAFAPPNPYAPPGPYAPQGPDAPQGPYGTGPASGPYGAPGYGAPGYGAPGYGTPGGYPPAGAPPGYGPPGARPPGSFGGPYAYPPRPTPTANRKPLIIALSIALAIFLLLFVMASLGTSSSSRFDTPRNPGFPGGGRTPGTTRAGSGSDDSWSVDRPLVGNGLVFFFQDEGLVAENIHTRSQVWQGNNTCPNPTWAEEPRTTAINPLLLRCESVLQALDWTNGQQLWSITLPAAAPDFIRTSPAVVVVAYPDKVLAYDAETGTKRWQKDLTATTKSTHPVAADATQVYVSLTDSVEAYDAKTGERVWQQPTGAGSMAMGDSGLVVRTDDQRVAVLSTTDGTVKTRSDPDPRLAWGVVVGSTVTTAVVRNRDGLVLAYSVTDGSQRWVSLGGELLPPGSTFPSTTMRPNEVSVTAVGGNRVIMTNNGAYRVLDAMTGRLTGEGAFRIQDRPSIDDGTYAFTDGDTGEVIILPLP